MFEKQLEEIACISENVSTSAYTDDSLPSNPASNPLCSHLLGSPISEHAKAPVLRLDKAIKVRQLVGAPRPWGLLVPFAEGTPAMKLHGQEGEDNDDTLQQSSHQRPAAPSLQASWTISCPPV